MNQDPRGAANGGIPGPVRPLHGPRRRRFRNRVQRAFLNRLPRNRNGRKKVHRHAHLMFQRPKRALTGYLVFMQSIANAQHREGGFLAGRDLVLEASAQWGRLSDERKAEFSQQAVEHRDRYMTQIAIWKARKAELTRPGTAYSQFVKVVYERDGPGDRTLPEMGRHTAGLWRDMTPEERQPYKDRHAELHQAFLARIQVLNAEYSARQRGLVAGRMDEVAEADPAENAEDAYDLEDLNGDVAYAGDELDPEDFGEAVGPGDELDLEDVGEDDEDAEDELDPEDIGEDGEDAEDDLNLEDLGEDDEDLLLEDEE